MNYTSRDFLRKLDPKVYEKAAELLKKGNNDDIGEFSCDAISYAVTGEHGSYVDDTPFNDKHLKAYRAFFAPKSKAEAKAHPFWSKGLDKDDWTEERGWYTYPSQRSLRRWKAQRIMALAMMAAIVRQAKR